MSKNFSRQGLLSLLLPVALVLFSAPADAATLNSGQTVTGTVIGGSSIDTYTFPTFTSTDTFYLNVRETGVATTNWIQIQALRPNGTSAGTSAGNYFGQLNLFNAASGTWTGKVSAGTPAGVSVNYGLTLYRIPGTSVICCGNTGGLMYPGIAYAGTSNRGSINVYTFYAATTGSATVNLTSTDGNWTSIYVLGPTGASVGSTQTSTVFNLGVNTSVVGTYTILAQRTAQDDLTSNYTLTVSGAPVGLSQIAKTDGANCFDCRVGGVAVGDPINVATGNLYESITDYTTAGTNPLSFTRHYNSQSYSRNLYQTALGPNWRSNYDRYLRLLSTKYAMAERDDGRVINFTSVSGTWTPDTDVDYLLFSSGSTWTLTDPDDTVETYTASGGKGTLNTIKQRNGYTQTLSYSSVNGLLTGVSDSYGRALGLNYSSATNMLSGVTTPDTLALSYGYTALSNAYTLTSVGYNTSPVTSQTYHYENTDLPWSLTGITDENGVRYTSWTYDGVGRVTSSQHALGADLTQISYDDTNGNRTVTGPLGIQETYSFSTLQGVPKVSQISRAANGTVAAATRNFTYDSRGYLKTATDWNGNLTAWANNTRGDPTTIIYASNSAVAQTTNIAYDTTWVHLPKTITTADSITTLSYDSAGNILTRAIKDQASQSVPYFTSGTGRNWTYTWNGTGQLLTAQLPRTDVTAKTTYGYTGGTLTSIANALSQTTNILTYTSGGLPLTVTDPNSVLTTLTYNPRNWLTSSKLGVAGGNLTTTLTYDSAGNLTRYTLPDASYLNYTYDNARRVTTITNALNETQGLTYNSAGGVTQTLWKDASAVTKRQHSATYDALNRMLTDVGGMGQTTTYGYDNNGNVLTITDPLSSVSTMTYDSAGRMASFKDPLTSLTAYTYDTHDRVLSVTDPRSKVTSYTWDGFGQMIQEVSPDRGTWVLRYDSDGNTSQQTDSNGFVTNMTYDALDRVLTRTYPADSSLNVAMTYDQAGHGKGVGRLTSLTDAAGSLSLDYDERGLVTANNRTISSIAYNTGFTYQSAGRLATLTYASSGWMAGYAYDAAGQVSGVTTKPPSLSAVNLATGITHLPFGPVKALTFANGVTSTRSFDLDYRMTAIQDNGGSNLYYSSNTFNANDNVIGIVDNVSAANNQTLQYDSANQLKFSSGSYGTGITLSYDSTGNRLTYGGSNYSVASTSNRYSSAAGNALTFTSSGNITAIGANPTFTYNKANQLASAVVSGTTSTYTYDAFGNRLKLVVGANPANIQSYGPGNTLLTEVNGGVKTDYAYLDGFPIAAIQPGASTISAIHTDYLGTPQKATNAAKAVVWSGAYDPNGAVTPTTSITMNLRFPGQYADATGLYHNGFRDYVPKFSSGGGRYLQADPIGLAGGINPFVYANSNAYRWTDSYGLQTAVPTPLGPLVLPVFAPGMAPKMPSEQEINKGAAEIAGATMRGLRIMVEGPAALINENTEDKSRQSKPTDCPSGTVGIDQAKKKHGIDHEQVEGIKKAVESGPKDWTGIAPNGDVITSGPNGEAINHGPWWGFTN